MKQIPNYLSKTSPGKVGDRFLVLINDDYNTFEHVIDCLTSLCDHTAVQAEQCALLTHYKGSCEVLVGSYSELELIKDDLMLYGLNVEIL